MPVHSGVYPRHAGRRRLVTVRFAEPEGGPGQRDGADQPETCTGPDQSGRESDSAQATADGAPAPDNAMIRWLRKDLADVKRQRQDIQSMEAQVKEDFAGNAFIDGAVRGLWRFADNITQAREAKIRELLDDLAAPANLAAPASSDTGQADEFAGELSEDYMAASNPVHVTRAVLGITTLLITLAVGGLSGVDVLRLWHGPPAGWADAWPAWTACFTALAGGTAFVQTVRAQAVPSVSATSGQLISAVAARSGEALLHRGLLLGVLTSAFASISRIGMEEPSLLAQLIATPCAILAVGLLEGAAAHANRARYDYHFSSDMQSAGKAIPGGRLLTDEALEAGFLCRLSMAIGSGTTIPWITPQSPDAEREQPLWPVVAAFAASVFLSAETLALGSLQASVATAVAGTMAATLLSPRSGLDEIQVPTKTFEALSEIYWWA